MGNPELPMIRVELESMRRQMVHAFAAEQLELDEMFQAALEKALDPEAIQKRLERDAKMWVESAVGDAVKEYFCFGNGKRAIREECDRMLDDLLGPKGHENGKKS